MSDPIIDLTRPERPDPMSDWCDEHQRWHQQRERPIRCSHPGCTEQTDHYHGTCEEHR